MDAVINVYGVHRTYFYAATACYALLLRNDCAAGGSFFVCHDGTSKGKNVVCPFASENGLCCSVCRNGSVLTILLARDLLKTVYRKNAAVSVCRSQKQAAAWIDL